VRDLEWPADQGLFGGRSSPAVGSSSSSSGLRRLGRPDDGRILPAARPHRRGGRCGPRNGAGPEASPVPRRRV